MHSRKKGVSPLLATVILVLITVVVSTMVSGFITSVSEDRSKRVQNLTQARLACMDAMLYVSNLTYDCNNGCFTGSPYLINATIQNSGSTDLSISTMSISLDNGESYTIVVNSSSLGSGSILTKNFNGIIVNSSPLMPIGTMDHRNAYVNDSRTLALWHFDEGSGTNAADSAGGNAASLINSPAWNASGRFGSALTFDGISNYVAVNAGNFSNSTATVEAWVNMNNVSVANNYTIFSTPSQISNRASGLVGLWHFEENSTTIIDSSPYGNNLSAYNSPYFNSSGRFGNGWTFSKSNDYMESSLNASGFSEITMSAWTKGPIGYPAVTNYVSGGMFLRTGGRADGRPGGGNYYYADCPSISADQWVFGAVTFKNGTMTSYQNGVKCTATVTGGNWTSHNATRIGTYYSNSLSGAEVFNSTIDEVAIYNRSLSDEEVRDLYLGGLSLHKQGDNLRFVAGNVTLAYNISSWSGWHHVAGAYASTTAALYADSSLVNSSANRGLVVLGSNAYIGGLFNSSNNLTFNGTIDEVRVSNITRNFTAVLNYTVSHPNIAFVRLFNQSNQLESASANLNGASYYSNQLVVNTAADYRIVVEDASGSTIEKWYPYRQGGSCKKTTSLDRITFSTNNCPDRTDMFYGSDVTFVGCV